MEDKLKKEKSQDVVPKAVSEDEAALPAKSGRDLFLERYRGYHPDLDGDPSDDDMWGYAGDGLTERDELKDKYDKLNGANETLALAVQEDPRVAQFISMIAGGENPMYAIGKSFGNLVDELDDEGLEKLKAGQAEFKARYNKMKDNFKAYESTLKAYAEKNGLTEEQAAQINNAILDIAEALNEGDIPEEVIDNVWKGMDYDNEKTAEVEAAKLAGKNEAIDAIKSKKSPSHPLPDLGVKTQKNRPSVMQKKSQDDFVDILADSEKIG